MEALLGGLLFAAFIFAQIAAVVAVHSESRSRQSDALEAIRRDQSARATWASGS
jgi:hypothetical protein